MNVALMGIEISQHQPPLTLKRKQKTLSVLTEQGKCKPTTVLMDQA